MALIISTWRWGDKYGPEYVDRLRDGVARNMRGPYRWAVFEPQEEDRHLTAIPGCFARLRMFDAKWQRANKIRRDDRVVCIDLDAVVTGTLDELFYRVQVFSILEGANAANPCRFNGSIFMLRGGHRHDVWDDFSLEAASKVPFHQFPDDQAWFEHKFPGLHGWTVGEASGIYAFQKPGWPKGLDLPRDARLVAFPGWRDPSVFQGLDWVREHWLNDRPGRHLPVHSAGA